jgi:hypothetical protein
MIMRGTVIYGAGDVRFEHLLGPRILPPSDAIVRIAATCVCGSDLWDYRGILKDIQDVDVLPVGTKLRSPDCRREYANYLRHSRVSRTAIRRGRGFSKAKLRKLTLMQIRSIQDRIQAMVSAGRRRTRRN